LPGGAASWRSSDLRPAARPRGGPRAGCTDDAHTWRTTCSRPAACPCGEPWAAAEVKLAVPAARLVKDLYPFLAAATMAATRRGRGVGIRCSPTTATTQGRGVACLRVGGSSASSIYERRKRAIWHEPPRDHGILRADGLAKAREPSGSDCERDCDFAFWRGCWIIVLTTSSFFTDQK
jgi:hypothetical protein